MVNRKLSDAEVTHLVELYQENEVLWNVTDKSYRSREARENAYARIRDSLNMPTLSLSDIGKKIKNLRSTYIKERKKIDDSIRAGTESVYKPKVAWFQLADGFLRKYITKRHTNTNMDTDLDPQDYVMQTFDLLEDSSQSTTTDFSDDSQNIPQMPKRKKINMLQNKTQGNCEEVITMALDDLDNWRKEVATLKEDECDAFGKYIASSLRQMPKKHFIAAKALIQQTITEIELRIMSEECTT